MRLDDDEIDRRIDTKRDPGLTRGQGELDLFYATFGDQGEAIPYEPCVEAMLDTAGLMESVL